MKEWLVKNVYVQIGGVGAICYGVVACLVYVNTLMVSPPFEGLQNQLTDLALNIRSVNTDITDVNESNVVIVDIDDESIEELGRPQLWPRLYDAQVIRYVDSGKPKSIGIDFLYTESDILTPIYADILKRRGIGNAGHILSSLSTDSELAAAIQTSGKVFLSLFNDDTKTDEVQREELLQFLPNLNFPESQITNWPTLDHPTLPIPDFTKVSAGIGSISMPSMRDGVVRFYQLVQKTPAKIGNKIRVVANFPFLMFLQANQFEAQDLRLDKEGIILPDKTKIPINDNGRFRINWLGDRQQIRYISFHKILNKKIPASFFENKYVFFGTSASGMQDLKTVPSQTPKMPGVEVHAQAFLNLMNQGFFTELSEVLLWPIFLIVSILLVFGYNALRPLFGLFMMIGLVFVEMFSYVLFVIPSLHIIFPVVSLILVTFFAYIGSSVFNYFTQEREKKMLKGAFGSYVSPDVVKQILKKGSELQLGGEKKELTVLFSDVRGFTTYSEKLDPQELVRILNFYLERMSEVIFRNKGTIDKFIGDAIMAIFGAPVEQEDHAIRSCQTAVDMKNELVKVNEHEVKHGRQELAVGIGINTGEMTVGNIGSRKRFDYTVIGDAVNLAARLEGLTKFFGVEILVSEYTVNLVGMDRFLFRELASVKVKGKDKPVIVYELISEYDKRYDVERWLLPFNEALKAFKAQDFEGAKNQFEKVIEEKGRDLTSQYYIGQCEQCMADPSHFSLTLKMETK